MKIRVKNSKYGMIQLNQEGRAVVLRKGAEKDVDLTQEIIDHLSKGSLDVADLYGASEDDIKAAVMAISGKTESTPEAQAEPPVTEPPAVEETPPAAEEYKPIAKPSSKKKPPIKIEELVDNCGTNDDSGGTGSDSNDPGTDNGVTGADVTNSDPLEIPE